MSKHGTISISDPAPAVVRRPIVLSIGTTEPWAAAGVQLDLFIADRLSVRLMNCVTAVSAQDGHGQFSVCPIPQNMIRAQLDALDGAAIKTLRIGALCNIGQVTEIADFLQRRPLPAIYDPVIATSSGGRFAGDEVVAAMRTLLFPHVALVTPNLDEAEALLGASVRNIGEMDAAALRIAEMGPRAVLIKGGHLGNAPVDVLWDGEQLRHFEASRLAHGMRGTGCALAITIAAAHAYGHSIRESVKIARDVVRILIDGARNAGDMWIAP